MASEFEVQLDVQAARDLKRLAKIHHPFLSRLKRAINSIGQNPLAGKPLKGSKLGCYSLREGDFRIIYELHAQKHIILLIRVGDRKEFYR